MQKFTRMLMLPLLALSLAGLPALAQDPDNHHAQDQGSKDKRGQDQRDNQSHNQRDNHNYVQHNDWQRGAQVNQDDWNRGDQVDYRQNHLPRPAQGHEWRMIDGHYVLGDRNGRIIQVRRAAPGR